MPFLVICGVKLDNVRTTATADLGFKTAGLYALPVDVDGAPSLVTIRQNISAAPGVESVTIADGLPLDFRAREVRVERAGESASRWAHITRVDTGYLETMGINLSRAHRHHESNNAEDTERCQCESDQAARAGDSRPFPTSTANCYGPVSSPETNW